MESNHPAYARRRRHRSRARTIRKRDGRSLEVARPTGCLWESVGPRLSLLAVRCKEIEMDARAKVTSKGQVTIPKSVREALKLHEGDELLFRVERSRALVAK